MKRTLPSLLVTSAIAALFMSAGSVLADPTVCPTCTTPVPTLGQGFDLGVDGNFAARVVTQGSGDADLTTWGMPEGATMVGSAIGLSEASTSATATIIATSPVCPGGVCGENPQNQVQMKLSASQRDLAGVSATATIPANTPLSGNQTFGLSVGSSALSAIGGVGQAYTGGIAAPRP